MTSNILDYHFRAINPTDFEIDLVYHAENKLMVHVYNKSRSKLLRKKNVMVAGNPDVIAGFDVPPEYINMLKTAIRPNVASIRKEVKQDGIEIMEWNVSDAKFKRVKEEWNICITVSGVYADKRE